MALRIDVGYPFSRKRFDHGIDVAHLLKAQKAAEEEEKLRLELEERRREAEAASKERGMLLSRISHELKTPLNGITGMLQALKFENKENVRNKSH